MTASLHVFHPAALERTFAAALVAWSEANAGTLLSDVPIVCAGEVFDLTEAPLAVIATSEETAAANDLLPASRAWTGEISLDVRAVRDVPLDDVQALAETVARAVAETAASGELAAQWAAFSSERMYDLFPVRQALAQTEGTRTFSTVWQARLQPPEEAAS